MHPPRTLSLALLPVFILAFSSGGAYAQTPEPASPNAALSGLAGARQAFATKESQAAEKDQAFAKELQAKAEKGDAGAQFQLGFWMMQGQGRAKNAAHALEWFRKSAAQGNANAEFLVGSYYLGGGSDVPKPDVEALKWFLKSAGQGNSDAQYSVGCCYESARGVPQDEVEAVKWFLKAAAQNNAEAQYRIAVHYEYGKGVPKDEV